MPAPDGLFTGIGRSDTHGGHDWYDACEHSASLVAGHVPSHYRSRTFSGIIGDIKVLPPRKALSLISRKKGLGLQYARLYLDTGIDHGYGYQACASEAVKAVLGESRGDVVRGDVLDVGCAVGVTAGVLGLDRITGFDLFPDLLRTARLVDTFTGARHRYAAADMTGPWPFPDEAFDTVICGLVCHHLKKQREVRSFFSEANRVLKPGGTLLMTLPAGSLARTAHMALLSEALEGYGFRTDAPHTGLVLSDDDPHSLFWMFLIVCGKTAGSSGGTFIHPGFGFPEFRTPVTRVEKGDRARTTSTVARRVRHRSFRLIGSGRLEALFGEDDLVFGAFAERITQAGELR